MSLEIVGDVLEHGTDGRSRQRSFSDDAASRWRVGRKTCINAIACPGYPAVYAVCPRITLFALFTVSAATYVSQGLAQKHAGAV